MYSKVVLVCLIVILAGLVLFLGGYLLTDKNPGQKANIANLSGFDSEEEGSQSDPASRLYRLSTTKATSPALSEDGKRVLFFEAASGKVLDSDFEGKDSTVVSGKLLTGFSTAEWSRSGYETLIALRSKNNLGYSYFNLKTGQISKLNPKITNPVWSPSGQKIAYLFFDSAAGEGQISVSNPDGSVYKNVLPARLDQIAVLWPKDNLLAFHNRTGEERTLFSLSADGEQLEKLLGPLANLKVLWSPDASKIWISYTVDQQKKASLVDVKNRTETAFDLITSADKCVWSANSVQVYCGGKTAEDQSEGLFNVDTKTSKVHHLFSPSGAEDIDIANPFLAPAENYIIFINAYDQYLYSISL
ncbi:MAG: hypothetical protein Q7S32_03505 [bacterium]|nr:hypothetical protein [bacterium]